MYITKYTEQEIKKHMWGQYIKLKILPTECFHPCNSKQFQFSILFSSLCQNCVSFWAQLVQSAPSIFNFFLMSPITKYIVYVRQCELFPVHVIENLVLCVPSNITYQLI
jgi:hypothetical protein